MPYPEGCRRRVLEAVHSAEGFLDAKGGMKMRGKILCASCVVLVAAAGAAAGEVDSPRSISRQEREEAVKKTQDAELANRRAEPRAVWMLRSELRKDREQVVKEIVGKRERLIAQLIELADEPEQVGAGRDANAAEPQGPPGALDSYSGTKEMNWMLSTKIATEECIVMFPMAVGGSHHRGAFCWSRAWAYALAKRPSVDINSAEITSLP